LRVSPCLSAVREILPCWNIESGLARSVTLLDFFSVPVRGVEDPSNEGGDVCLHLRTMVRIAVLCVKSARRQI
jgi:hypothetical protein